MILSNVLSSALAGALLAMPASQQAPTAQQKSPSISSIKSIPATAVAAGDFNTLVTALQAAELVSVLEGEGPFTVFAPTDAAFAKLPAGTVETLLKPENRDRLVQILTYHVVPGKVLARDVVKIKNAGTVAGPRAKVKVDGGKVFIDQAQVVKTDIACSNGVIHVIDEVIIPTDKTIPQVATEAGTFNTLLAAVKAAGLVDVLSSKGPFTVFAPTDEAFAKLPKGTVESLLKPENQKKLVEILTYHVVPGRVYSDQVVELSEAPTVLGRNVPVAAAKGRVTVGGADVVAVDIDAANGVIHVIDEVMIPGAETGSAADAPAKPAKRKSY